MDEWKAVLGSDKTKKLAIAANLMFFSSVTFAQLF